MSTSLVSLPPSATVADARRTMMDHRVSALPVVDSHGRAAGMVSKTDLMASGTDDVPVALLMANQVATCTPDLGVVAAARRMRTKRVHHLVVAEDGRAVGILSVFDLLQVFDLLDADHDDAARDDSA